MMNSANAMMAGRFRRLRRAPRRRGMTLIEIMVAVAIVVILIGMAVFVGASASDKAKIKQTKALMEGLRVAMQEYRDDTGSYPAPAGYIDENDRSRGAPVGSNENRRDFYQDEEGDATIHSSGSYCGVVDVELMRCATTVSSDNPRVYSIQGLYYQLMNSPAAKQALARVDQRYIILVGSEEFEQEYRRRFTDPSAQGNTINPMDPGPSAAAYVMNTGANGGPPMPSAIIVDAWGNPLAFQGGWGNVNNGVPYLHSAGPDGEWGNDDDIYSYD